ncbi:hypothetical protein [Myxococcus sp. AB025B]|uniref:hypothetical protein n=1 Tax=Myxococcus sp. AB025B TaxID=2562794 RepID=UPI00114315F9|nr:hypothetical protein [Myxococcus sp. AB025B]
MAAPREVPIILGVFVALAAMMAHVLATRLDGASPRAEGPRVAPLAAEARVPSPRDWGVIVGVGVLGLVALGAQVRSRRARLREQVAIPPRSTEEAPSSGPSVADARAFLAWRGARRVLARRTVLVLVEWSAFTALSLWLMLHAPSGDWPVFALPCALLVGPSRVYVRYREGESLWAPWLLGLSVLVLAMTREPRCTWGLLLIAGVCQGCVWRQERARRGVTSSG